MSIGFGRSMGFGKLRLVALGVAFGAALAGCPKHEPPAEDLRAPVLAASVAAANDAEVRESRDGGGDGANLAEGGALAASSSWADAVRAERWDDARALLDALTEAAKNAPETKLARARVARMLGHDAEAVALLASLEEALPLLADVIAKERALAAMKAGPIDKAAEWLCTQRAPSSWLLGARAWDRAGNAARARTECERVLSAGKRSRAEEEAARTLHLRLVTDANDALAVETDARWLAVYALDDVVAADAEARLARMKPPKPLTAEELVTRARTLAEAGRADAAWRAIERATHAKGKLSKIDTCRARAEVLYKARTRYAEAASAYRTCAAMPASPHAAEDAFLAARSLSRADRNADAIAAFTAVAKKYPKTTWAEQAEFHVARTYALDGNWLDAAKAFDTYAARGPQVRDKAEADRYRAIAHLMASHAKVARKLLEDLAGDAKDPLMQARWTNLAALAALHDGERLHATARWAEVARSQPASWPALVARARLASLSASIPPVFEPAPQDEAPAPMRPELPEPAGTLHRIGLDGDAEAVLRDREGAIVGRVGSREVEALCDVYGLLDPAKRRFQIARRLPSALLATAPTPKNRFAWNCAYPRPHESRVRAEAEARGVPAALVWAVMRQESAFDPEVVSPARAVGLMQLMPKTAREVATTAKIDHDEAWLSLPGHNIALGTRYLRELLDDLGGNTPLAVAAYNAGPEAIERWKARLKDTSLDVFVEMIPFLETREYVVRVMGNRARYEILERQDGGISDISLSLDGAGR